MALYTSVGCSVDKSTVFVDRACLCGTKPLCFLIGSHGILRGHRM